MCLLGGMSLHKVDPFLAFVRAGTQGDWVGHGVLYLRYLILFMVLMVVMVMGS